MPSSRVRNGSKRLLRHHTLFREKMTMFERRKILISTGLVSVASVLATAPASGQAQLPDIVWNDMNALPSPTSNIAPGIMAYDNRRGKVVMFGGRDGSNVTNGETWELSGNTWTKVHDGGSGGPEARHSHALAYDSRRGVTVLFGGESAAGTRLRDTWEWDGITWEERAPTVSPPVRYAHAMAYDSWRGETIMFSGNGGGNLGSTWSWDGESWEEVATTGPGSRTSHAMAFDGGVNRGVVVLFGGWSGFERNDTWEWDGTEWQEQPKCPGVPKIRHHNAMAYDPLREGVVMFGGTDDQTTWIYSGDCWEESYVRTPPQSRLGAGMVYDFSQRSLVMYGGQLIAGTAIHDTLAAASLLTCYADCDQSTGAGVLDIFDFLCFQDAFIAGCP